MKKTVLNAAVTLFLIFCNNEKKVPEKEIESFSNFEYGKKIVTKNNNFAFSSFKKVLKSNIGKNTLYYSWL